MWKRLETLPYCGLLGAESLRRTLPIWLLAVVALALGACKKTY